MRYAVKKWEYFQIRRAKVYSGIVLSLRVYICIRAGAVGDTLPSSE